MNRRRLLPILGVVAVLAIVGGGIFLIWLNTGGDASRETSAPTLAPRTEATAEPTAEAVSEAEATAESVVTQAAASETIFRIDPTQSTVRFSLDETLAGNRITVVGSTREVAGDVRVDFANPSNSELGTVVINMRTLQTDNSNRDGAMRRFILRTAEDQYEFSSFVPASISGLPASVSVGDTVNFQVTGDFNVVDVTQPLTFDVTLTVDSETQISGSATAILLRSEWAPIANFQVPPQVADVGEEVTLAIDFVALAVE